MATIEFADKVMLGETQGDAYLDATRAPRYSGPDEPMVTI